LRDQLINLMNYNKMSKLYSLLSFISSMVKRYTLPS
jgi:hypothetical protein